MGRVNYISFPKLGLDFELAETVNIFGFNIYWYGIIIGMGMVIASAIAFWEFKKKGYKSDDLVDFLLFAIPLGIIGARAYYVIFEWDYYKNNLSEIIAVWNGGLAVYGGVIAGSIVALIFSKIKKIPFLWFADVATCGLFIAQSIGRWGNFINAEAFGSLTQLPWGMMTNGRGPWHPTFFYESMWNLAGFLISYFVIHRIAKRDGCSFAYYLIWYGTGRFFIEGLRTDSLYLYGNIRVSQVVACVSVMLGIGVLCYIKRMKKSENNV